MPKGLTAAARHRAREALARLRERRTSNDDVGWQTKIAELLEVSPSTVSRLWDPDGSGGSQDLVERIARELGEDPAEILFGVPGERNVPALKDLPNFRACLKEARHRCKVDRIPVPDWAWNALPEWRSRPPVRAITSDRLIQIALGISADPDSPEAPP